MRDWTKLLLSLCVVALGAGLFLLERRISGLEAELQSARAEIAALNEPRTSGRILPLTAELKSDEARPPLRIVVPRKLDGPSIEIAPPAGTAAARRLERQPSGEINGVPFYHNLLGQSER